MILAAQERVVDRLIVRQRTQDDQAIQREAEEDNGLALAGRWSGVVVRKPKAQQYLHPPAAFDIQRRTNRL